MSTFRRFSEAVALAAGTSWAFIGACALILAWAVVGFIIGFTDTVQLVINTTTTIITFLMVFVIQATQNADSKALHAKINELIVGLPGARNAVVDAERLSNGALDALLAEIRAEHGPGGAVPPDAP